MELARTAATLQSVAKMNEACSAAIREDWRGSANLYRSTYETASPEFEAWFYALDGYTSIFRMRHTTPTEADMRFIRRVEDNPAAPTLHRAHCAFSRGLLFWDSGNRAKAVHCYRHAIELAEAASPSECNAKIFFAPRGFLPMRTVMEDFMRDCRGNLAALAGSSQQPLSGGSAATPVEQGDDPAISGQKTWVPFGPHFWGDSHHASLAILNRYHAVHPGTCDKCGKKAAHILQCGKCRSTRYCGASCQREDWAEHKKGCRKPKDFKAGDLVRLWGLESTPELNGSILQVLGAASSPGIWRVSILGGDKSVTTSADNMTLVVCSEDRAKVLEG
jgi:hypothetical protein